MELKEFAPVCEAVLKKSKIDTPRYPVIDFHTHMGKLLLGENFAEKYDTAFYVSELKKNGVEKVVDLDGFYGSALDAVNEKAKGFEDFFVHFMWIDFEKFGQEEFEENTRTLILDSYEKGCRGIKLWKNISLYMRDEDGKPIRTDDARLDVIYDTAAELRIPVLMHIADPTAFFKPKDAHNERYEELDECPDWEFSDRSRYMSFEELMEMQENTIRNHPDTTFVIAHVGSYAENLSWVSEQLRKYPNMYVDIAARIAELGRVPYSARKFFTEHQDRIVFGTDSTPLTMGYHPIYYRFLETEDEYFPYHLENEMPGQGRWEIYGLHLDEDILKKIYYQNACRLLLWDVEAFEEEFGEKIFEC